MSSNNLELVLYNCYSSLFLQHMIQDLFSLHWNTIIQYITRIVLFDRANTCRPDRISSLGFQSILDLTKPN